MALLRNLYNVILNISDSDIEKLFIHSVLSFFVAIQNNACAFADDCYFYTQNVKFYKRLQRVT